MLCGDICGMLVGILVLPFTCRYFFSDNVFRTTYSMNNVKLIQAKDFQNMLYNPTCIITKHGSIIMVISNNNPFEIITYF